MRYPAIRQEPLSSMRNALRLLNLFSMDEPELTLKELAGKLEVGISTAHRLTATLIEEGFIIRDPVSKKFRLAASILAMGHTILTCDELCLRATPVLEKLARESGETAHLAILKENRVIYMQKVDSSHPVHLLSHIGRHNPVHCTSSGQVILAFQPEDEIERVIARGLPRYTSNTVTAPDQFKQKLEAIRRQAYALSIEELHDGVSSIAAPVKNRSGRTIASVSIAGPTSRIHSAKEKRLIQLVMEAAYEVSKQL